MTLQLPHLHPPPLPKGVTVLKSKDWLGMASRPPTLPLNLTRHALEVKEGSREEETSGQKSGLGQEG